MGRFNSFRAYGWTCVRPIDKGAHLCYVVVCSIHPNPLVTMLTTDREPAAKKLTKEQLVAALITVTRESKQLEALRKEVHEMPSDIRTGTMWLLLVEAIDNWIIQRRERASALVASITLPQEVDDAAE